VAQFLEADSAGAPTRRVKSAPYATHSSIRSRLRNLATKEALAPKQKTKEGAYRLRGKPEPLPRRPVS
jgi:hypothetical protein